MGLRHRHHQETHSGCIRNLLTTCKLSSPVEGTICEKQTQKKKALSRDIGVPRNLLREGLNVNSRLSSVARAKF